MERERVKRGRKLCLHTKEVIKSNKKHGLRKKLNYNSFTKNWNLPPDVKYIIVLYEIKFNVSFQGLQQKS